MRHVISFAALALASVLATEACAQQLSWHAGIGIGGDHDQRGPHDFDAHGDNARSVFVGAGFGHGFGIEAAYVDLGRLFSPGIADAGFDLDGELWSVGATYAVALDAFEPYAKLGWFSRRDDGIAINIAGPVPLRIHDDGVMGEVGLRFRIGEAFALRAGYLHYDFETGDDGSAQLGAEWHF